MTGAAFAIRRVVSLIETGGNIVIYPGIRPVLFKTWARRRKRSVQNALVVV